VTAGQYQLHGPVIHVRVRGLPIGQGAIRSLGRGRPSVHANAKALKPWRALIAAEIGQALRLGTTLDGPIPGPIAAGLTFTVPKPKTAPKRRRIYPITRPDLDHYIRAVLDALVQGGALLDDSRVIELHAVKTYPLEHARALPVPGLDLRLFEVGDDHLLIEAAS
jgi:Holliday junction resolvase RusA-like endonuclease